MNAATPSDKNKFSSRWLVVTGLCAATIGVLVFAVSRFGGEPPIELTPDEQRWAGVTSDQYTQISDLRKKFISGDVSEADWSEVERVINERTPVGITLGISALGRLSTTEDRRRALTIVEQFADSTPSDEQLHVMVGEILLNYARTGSAEEVRQMNRRTNNSRLKEAGVLALEISKEPIN